MAFKRKSKNWSILLTIAMLFMLWPGGAAVADPPAGTVSVTSEQQLRNTVANAVYEGYTISIDNNINLTSGNLNIGQNITFTSSDGKTLDAGNNKITVSADALTFNGNIEVTGSATSVIEVGGTASFTLGGSASVRQTGTNSSGAVKNNGGTVAINGGTVESSHTGINNDSSTGTVTVTSGTITGTTDAINNYGTLNVTGGVIGSTSGTRGINVRSGSTANISGGSISGSTSAVAVTGTANISGGSFTGKAETTSNGSIIDIDLSTSGSVSLSEGVQFYEGGHYRYFLTALPAVPFTATQGQESTVSLTGAHNGVNFAVDTSTDAELGATAVGSGSTATVNMIPTASGSYKLVLTAAGTGTASGQTFKLTLPVTITAPSLPALAAPLNLAWDGTTPGKAKWDAVTNASSYSVQLYKGGTPEGSAVSVSSGTEHDFTAAIITTGSYTFKVTAVGDGTTYSNSPPSAASPAYSYILPTAVCEVSSVPTKAYTSLAAALAEVEDGQTITLLGDINHNTGDNTGIVIDGKTVIFNLNGRTLNVTTDKAKGIDVKNNGKLELWGDSGALNVTATWDAVVVDGSESSAVVTSATSTKNAGVRAANGGEITVRGDAIGGAAGVSAAGENSKVTVGGDAKSTENNYTAVEAVSGAEVAVTGNVITAGTGSKGVYASAPGTKVHIVGNIQATQIGVDASSSAEVTVEGNVSATTNPPSWAYGVRAQTKAKVTVRGDVSANDHSSSIGVVVNSTPGFTPTEVTVDGTISGTTYIRLRNNAKTENDKEISTTKPGYYTYTLTDSEGTHTVWVKDPAAPGGPTGPAVWHYRSPLPTSNIIEKAIFISGKYMAVGYNGTLITSPDGITWQKVDVGTDTDRLTGIAHGNGKYVIVGTADSNYYAARIYTSDNGTDWRETAAIPEHGLYDVVYGDDGFVAVGQSGKILHSDDGENWDVITVNPMDYTLLSITYGNGKYVAASMRKHTGITQRGAIMTSADGVEWDVTHTNSTNTLWDITYAGSSDAGTFVAVGGESTGSYYICTSSDGATWTQRSNSGSAYAQLLSVTYVNSQFIAVGSTNSGGSSGANKAFITTSVNGISWSDRSDTTKSGLRVIVGDSNNNVSVAMGGTGNIYTSDNGGTSWDYRTLGATKHLNSVAWNGSDLFVSVGIEGTIQTSPDGVNWTIRTSGTSYNFNEVEYLNGQFIAVGRNGIIFTSGDGSAWTSRSSGTTRDLKGIAYGAGKYVVVGGDNSSNPVVLTSENGMDWSQVTNDPPFINRSFVTVAYGNGVFLALMQYGQAYVSSDGTNWSSAADLPGSGKYPTDMIYAGGKFAAVGGYGEIYLSSDNGASWTVIDTALDSYSWSITYSSGNFVAVGGLGKIMASADGGTTWFVQPSGLTYNPYFSLDSEAELAGIAAGGSNFVAVGGNGITLQSDSFSVSTDADAQDVDIAIRSLGVHNILGSGSNYSAGNIVANMNLVTSGLGNTAISWESSKPAYIAANGTVTRPGFSAGDQVVDLTATVSKGAASRTKTFTVVVKAQPNPDIADVDAAYAALTFDTIKGSNTAENSIGSDLTLPVSGASSTTLSWSSNKPAYIAADGTVTRPAQGAGNEVVILTATITKGAASRTKTFSLTVKALVDPDTQAVTDAKAALTFNVIKGSNTAANNIVSDLTLPVSGANSTAISWSSNKPAYIAADGTVTRPAQGAGNEVVILTATITKGAASDTQIFHLMVTAVAEQEVTGITVRTQPTNLTYTAGESLDLDGLVVALTYSDSSTLEVGYEDFIYMGITAVPAHGTGLTTGHHNQPVEITCNGQTAYTSNLTVTASPEREVTGITVRTQPDDLTYTAGESLDLSGLVVTLTYSDSSTLEVGYEDFIYMGITAVPAHGTGLTTAHHNQPVAITCNGQTAYTSNLTVTAGSSGGGGGGSAPSGTLVTPAGSSNVSGNGVTLSIPAGAVASNVRVQVREASLTSGMSLPDDSRLISRVVDIVKDKSGNFAEPVTITMSFNQSQIDPEKYDIKICCFNEESGEWVELDSIEVNLDTGTVSGNVNHFTKFAVIATLKKTEQQPLPEPQPEAELPADVTGHWAQDSITKLIAAGVISGYPDGRFQPDKTVTRAEFTVMLVKALKLESKEGSVFADTAAHWAKDSIGTAAAHGLISGYDQSRFGPDDNITREQAAVIIARAANLQMGDQALSFSDARQVSPWALSGVAAAVGKAYLSGYPDNSFRPQDYTSRAEAAAIIAKLL
ncbi:MAG TPA: immunoglobulin-like domain-containing protein [Syntrophomonas sp.]|nr:immunoglobulin-like domain-containing protein [Syntrophomonas sp.]